MSDVERRRVAAAIVRERDVTREVLMVRERRAGTSGRHDGPEYWTLPGGGIEPGEDLEVAVRREVLEETGLTVVAARFLFDFPYHSGWTDCFAVEVLPGEPRLGVDDDLTCDCPRMVGLDWVRLPDLKPDSESLPIPTMIMTGDPSSTRQ